MNRYTPIRLGILLLMVSLLAVSFVFGPLHDLFRWIYEDMICGAADWLYAADARIERMTRKDGAA
jgi:hypothetical protein